MPNNLTRKPTGYVKVFMSVSDCVLWEYVWYTQRFGGERCNHFHVQTEAAGSFEI